MSRILGFDVRYAPAAFVDLRWDDASREAHLIEPGVKVPLSVDRSVWPSRFRLEGSAPPVITRADDIWIAPDPETAYFEAFDLWPTLGSMLPRHNPYDLGDCAILICFADEAIYEGRLKSDDFWRATYADADALQSPDPGWIALGNDVANGGLLSALSNCGLGNLRRRDGRPAWARSLNAHGLLSDPRDAVEACRFMNARPASDGPFYVFELYLVWGKQHLGLAQP